VGYFPFENPKFSCIVVIHNPKEHGYYGSDVAGPVFREIADKSFFATLDIHEPVNARPAPVLAGNRLPSFDFGNQKDLREVLDYLELPVYGEPPTDMAMLRARSDSLLLERKTIPERRVPSVVGMGLKNALYILENLGLTVEVDGVGKVALQSIRPGTPALRQTIRITLK
jgi:cell division protein FtsI (penicillin-binding protein 3)